MSDDRVIRSAAQLCARLSRAIDGFAGPLEVERLSGGRSNPTYRLDTPTARYVLRRQPDGELLPSAHRMDREFRILSALHARGFPVPRPLHLEMAGDPIGVGYYVMAHLDGHIVEDPALPQADPIARRAMYEQAVDTLASLHRILPEEAGLADFGKPAEYYQRQMRRWSSQRRAVPAFPLPCTDALIAALETRLPEQRRNGIVHGDYRLGNIMFGTGGIAGVLDWELSTLGDPTADLAYLCLPYHMSPESGMLRGLAGLPLAALGIPGEAETIARYYTALGMEVPNDWAWHLAFAGFRLAIISLGVLVRDAESTGQPLARRDLRVIEEFAAAGLGRL